MARVSSERERTATKHLTLGFGVPATSDPHHFKVIIPRANSGLIEVVEYLGLQAQSDEYAVVKRISLERRRWTAIRSEVQRAFNARLKSYGLKTSSWQVGENVVDRLLGKELCVLAWAIEVMDVDNIPVAVRNWLALRPEERWWLFGMTAKSSGGVEDGDVGWRVALRHALGDIVQSEQAEFEQAESNSTSLLPESAGALPVTPRSKKGQPSTSKGLNDKGSLPKAVSASLHSGESSHDFAHEEETFFLFEAKQAKAVGLPVGDKNTPKFLVKKGSSVNTKQAKSVRPAIRELRQKLLDDGVLIEAGEVFSFAQEYLFESPSAAACVIAGNPRSGMDAWKDLQGHSLKDLGYGKKSK